MSFGLKSEDVDDIISAISAFPEIEKAVIFGSRAKGSEKRGSDVDIAIYGDAVNFNTVSRLHALLEEMSPMPYFFDVVDYTHLTQEALKAHIDRVGKAIYTARKGSESLPGKAEAP